MTSVWWQWSCRMVGAVVVCGVIVGLVHSGERRPPPAASAKAAFAMVGHLPVRGVAEIVAASADGLTLVYTSADAGRMGVVDITDPAHPRSLPDVDVRRANVGEPTSVAVTADNRYAVVAVRLGDDVAHAHPGMLQVYDISRPSAVRHVKDIIVGIGPDCVALAGSGRTLRAVVAIEDEETTPEGNATLAGARPGQIDVVGLQDLYGAVSTGVQSLELVAAARTAGVPYANDPQPEFISIHPQTQQAVISLQENNAVAIVNLSNITRPRLTGVYSTGTVSRQGTADLRNDGEISLTESFSGRREPDAVAWVTAEVFATANEGDTVKGEDGIWPGARGFSLLDRTGQVIFESGAQTEQHAALYGHYPDRRSTEKGVEVEGLAVGEFGGIPHLIVGSERGSFVEIYRVDDVRSPRFVQLLPTGVSPEGFATVTRRADGRQLFVSANEAEGSLSIYQFFPDGPPINTRDPQLMASHPEISWGALSGLTADGDSLYAIPDNAMAQTRIYRINPTVTERGQMLIDAVTFLTTPEGAPLQVDAEGIARVADGFWIAAEGKTFPENELIKIDLAGAVTHRIRMSDDMVSRNKSLQNTTGIEGVTASPDGKTLYVALQRGFDPTQPLAAILKYDIPEQTWSSASYPLDRHSVDAEQYWTGLSDIHLAANGRLLVIERDKGGDKARAINAEIKRIYSINAAEVTDGALLTKTLVRDLVKEFNYRHEKPEGLTVWKGDLWIVNDNDGAGWTRMLNAGKW